MRGGARLFRVIAQAVAQAREECADNAATPESALDTVTQNLADALTEEFDNFDRSRFFAAAGGEDA